MMDPEPPARTYLKVSIHFNQIVGFSMTLQLSTFPPAPFSFHLCIHCSMLTSLLFLWATTAAGLRGPSVAVRMPTVPRCQPAARATSITLSEPPSEVAPAISTAYTVAGVATATAWTACAIVALSSHPNAAINAACGVRHNVLTIAQGLALPLPLVWAVVGSLRSAAMVGWGRLSSATYRRLNLGLAVASAWMCAAVVSMPAFAYGYDMYSPALKLGAIMAHGFTTLLCLGVWGRTVRSSPPPLAGHYIPRVVRGLIGSFWSLAPTAATSDPDAAESDGRAEYALCAVLFAWFAVQPVVSPFPLATVPAILGKRLSRAASGWTFLAAVVSFSLKVFLPPPPPVHLSRA